MKSGPASVVLLYAYRRTGRPCSFHRRSAGMRTCLKANIVIKKRCDVVAQDVIVFRMQVYSLFFKNEVLVGGATANTEKLLGNPLRIL
jgi:hypothetical protein